MEKAVLALLVIFSIIFVLAFVIQYFFKKQNTQVIADANPLPSSTRTQPRTIRPHAKSIALLRIDYVDADGVETTRDIEPFRFKQDDLLINAFCRLRQEERSFVPRRIKHCVEIETGTFISNIPQYLYHKSFPERDHLSISYAANSMPSGHVESDGDNGSAYNDNYWFSVEKIKRHVVAHLLIKYQKTNFAVSEHQFDLKSFSRGEKGYFLYGYSLTKNRDIDLSSLGIVEAIDRDTGEQIANIYHYLERLYKYSPARSNDYLFESSGWAIYLLLYFAAINNRVDKRERQVIVDYIKGMIDFKYLEDEYLHSIIKGLYRYGHAEIRSMIRENTVGYNFEPLVAPIIAMERLQKTVDHEFKLLKAYLERNKGVSFK